MAWLSRFEKFVDRSGGLFACWPWTGTRLPAGYGSFSFNGTKRVAHRILYEAQFGAVPQGLELDHLCRNKACVNPAHLEAVTHQVNVARATGPVAENARKTHCIRGHALVEGNLVRFTKSTRRKCLTCRRLRERGYVRPKRPRYDRPKQARPK